MYCEKCKQDTLFQGTICTLCGEESKNSALSETIPENNAIVLSIKENRCLFCGTPYGLKVKVGNEITEVQAHNLGIYSICTLCYQYLPDGYSELDLTRLTWDVIVKRLNQREVYTKICEGCSAPIVSTKKLQRFCSDSCRAKTWMRKNYKKIEQ